MAANVGDLLATVAASLRPELPSMCAAMVEQMAREIPDLAADASIEELLTGSVAANVATILDLFEAGADNAQLEAPAAAVEYARRLAQRGVAISALLRAYRLGRAAFQQRMIRGVSEHSTVTEVVVEAAMELAATTFNYIDRISEHVVVAYQTERDRWLRNRGAVRSARVMSLLSEGEVNIGEAEKSLAYPLRQTHRGVVVWVEAGSEALDRLSRLNATWADLASTTAATGHRS